MRSLSEVSATQRAAISRSLVGDALIRWSWGVKPAGLGFTFRSLAIHKNELLAALQPSLDIMRARMIPRSSDTEPVRLVGADDSLKRARAELLGTFPSRELFGEGRDLADLLADICIDLLWSDIVPVLLVRPPTQGTADDLRGESGPVAHIEILRSEGVEQLRSGDFKIYPHASWLRELRWRNGHGQVEYVARPDVILYTRPHSVGRLPPILAALPAILADRRLVQGVSARVSAQVTDRPTFRQQLQRWRGFDLNGEELTIQARKMFAMRASIIDHFMYHPDLVASLPEYFLAWQHLDAVRTTDEIRHTVVTETNRKLMPQLAGAWGGGEDPISVEVGPAITARQVEEKFLAFNAGEINFTEFSRQTGLWLSKSN